MITKLVCESEVIGTIGEDDGDPRHPQVLNIIDGPGGEVLEVTRVLEERDEDGHAVIEVALFGF